MKFILFALLSLRLFAGPLDGVKPSIDETRHVSTLLGSCIVSSCVSTVNIAFDTAGTPCPTGTWGMCGAVQTPIQFDDVPTGYSVSILRVYGDFIGWVHPETLPTVIPAGSHSGLLWGLFNSNVAASPNVEYGSSGCFIYFQGSVSTGDFRGPFDQVIQAGGILPSNDLLISQQAIFLNDTGQSIHQEATFALVYQFTKAQGL
jgi:hypothetical protein